MKALWKLFAIVTLLLTTSAMSHVASADMPIRYLVSADFEFCGTTIHMEGPATFWTDHWQYDLAGTDEDSTAYMAHPSVHVRIANQGHSESFILLDHFNILYQNGGGLYRQFYARYNYHWANGVLVADQISYTEDCR